jgi:4-amino-4-deoxy-L-arabinose transferase-like glycosyltransferase
MKQIADCRLQIADCPSICNLQSAICNRRYLLSAILLLVLSGSLFFPRLGERDLWSSHEGRAAQDAQVLLEDGLGRMPQLFDGRPELQKPPLYYWLVALLSWCGGGHVGPWSVRLPAAVAGLLGVLGLHYFCRRRGRPVAALVAAAVLATALRYTWLARVGRIDMPLTLATGTALGGFFLAWRDRGTGRWVKLMIAYFAVAAGLLLKGPIGAALPVAVASVWLLLRGEIPLPWNVRSWLRLMHDSGLWWGAPLVLLLTVPCYVWANIQTGGEFVRVFLVHHNFERGFGGSVLLRAHPWWFYGPRLLADFLPWSLLLPIAGFLFLRRRSWRDDAEASFGLVWLVVMMLLLSAMRFKRGDYLLPAFPGAALFLGCVAERVLAERTASVRRLKVGFLAILVACVVGWWLFLDYDLRHNEPGRQSVRFAEEIRRRAPAPQQVSFFRTESHDLAFHVGRPLAVFVEWERLDALAAQPEAAYVVMPAQVAAEASGHLRSGRLEEVLRESDPPARKAPSQLKHLLPQWLCRQLERPGRGEMHKKPLVLLRTMPGTGISAP